MVSEVQQFYIDCDTYSCPPEDEEESKSTQLLSNVVNTLEIKLQAHFTYLQGINSLGLNY